MGTPTYCAPTMWSTPRATPRSQPKRRATDGRNGFNHWSLRFGLRRADRAARAAASGRGLPLRLPGRYGAAALWVEVAGDDRSLCALQRAVPAATGRGAAGGGLQYGNGAG